MTDEVNENDFPRRRSIPVKRLRRASLTRHLNPDVNESMVKNLISDLCKQAKNNRGHIKNLIKELGLSKTRQEEEQKYIYDLDQNIFNTLVEAHDERTNVAGFIKDTLKIILTKTQVEDLDKHGTYLTAYEYYNEKYKFPNSIVFYQVYTRIFPKSLFIDFLKFLIGQEPTITNPNQILLSGKLWNNIKEYRKDKGVLIKQMRDQEKEVELASSALYRPYKEILELMRDISKPEMLDKDDEHTTEAAKERYNYIVKKLGIIIKDPEEEANLKLNATINDIFENFMHGKFVEGKSSNDEVIKFISRVQGSIPSEYLKVFIFFFVENMNLTEISDAGIDDVEAAKHANAADAARAHKILDYFINQLREERKNPGGNKDSGKILNIYIREIMEKQKEADRKPSIYTAEQTARLVESRQRRTGVPMPREMRTKKDQIDMREPLERIKDVRESSYKTPPVDPRNIIDSSSHALQSKVIRLKEFSNKNPQDYKLLLGVTQKILSKILAKYFENDDPDFFKINEETSISEAGETYGEYLYITKKNMEDLAKGITVLNDTLYITKYYKLSEFHSKVKLALKNKNYESIDYRMCSVFAELYPYRENKKYKKNLKEEFLRRSSVETQKILNTFYTRVFPSIREATDALRKQRVKRSSYVVYTREDGAKIIYPVRELYERFQSREFDIPDQSGQFDTDFVQEVMSIGGKTYNIDEDYDYEARDYEDYEGDDDADSDYDDDVQFEELVNRGVSDRYEPLVNVDEMIGLIDNVITEFETNERPVSEILDTILNTNSGMAVDKTQIKDGCTHCIVCRKDVSRSQYIKSKVKKDGQYETICFCCVTCLEKFRQYVNSEN